MSALQLRDRDTLNCGVYKIESPSGGFYIGSSVDVDRRFKQHKSDLRKGRHVNQILQRSANKYGVESLTFSCIATVLNKEDIRAVEQIIMDDLGPEYNISKNAYSAIFDEDVVAKRVATLSKPIVRLTDGAFFKSGYEASRAMGGDSNRDQLPTALKNGWKWLGHFWKYANDSKTLADAEAEAKKKDAARKMNAAIAVTKARSRPVICLNTGVLYPSCTAAEAATGICSGGVSQSAITKTTAGGFFWRFECDAVSLEEAQHAYSMRDTKAKDARAKSIRARLCKSVRCIETGEVFESVSSATKSKSIHKDAVRMSITGAKKVCGFSWEYVDA